MEDSRYSWRFRHNGRLLETKLNTIIHGEMSFSQWEIGTKNSFGMPFSQEIERFLFVLLLRYLEQEKGRKGSVNSCKKLLSKLKHPGGTGKYFEGMGDDNLNNAKSDFMYFFRGIPKKGNNCSLPHDIYLIHESDSLYFNLKNNNKSKAVFPYKQAERFMHGIIDLSSRGRVRTSGRQLKDRLEYYVSGKHIEDENERMAWHNRMSRQI